MLYNLLEYSKNYRKTTGSLWNYYRDEQSDPLSSDSKSFEYKTSITGNTYNFPLTITDDGGNQVDNPDYDTNKAGKKEIADMTTRVAGNNNNPPAIVPPTG